MNDEEEKEEFDEDGELYSFVYSIVIRMIVHRYGYTH
jgi:hypothetical protein